MEYLVPDDVAAAVRMLGAGRVVLAGGTDVYPQHVGRPMTTPMIDIGGLADLRGIDATADTYRIGALTRWADVAGAALPSRFDGLRAAARQVGAVQVQNAATVGGNLCNASPAADGIPPLLTLDASVELTSVTGSRVLPLERFLTGYRQTALQPDELLTAVLIPRGTRDDARSAFLKLGLRRYPGDLGRDGGGRGDDGPGRSHRGGQGRDRRMLAGGTATAIARGGARRPVTRRCGRGHDRRASRRAQPDRRCPCDGGVPTPGGGGVGAPRAPELRGRPLSSVTFDVNGSSVRADRSARRLSDMLRDDLGFTATKVGCDAGDCGACTVLLDGEPVSACMTPVGGLAGRQVQTLEGLHASGECHGLQTAFLMHGAAQCGICTPGMLVSAAALLRVTPAPTEQQVMDALGGVLCRCTGYRKIITAVMNAGAAEVAEPSPPVGKAVGHRVRRVDGQRKVDGTDVFGADDSPAGALVIRVVRSPFHRARFQLGDLDAYVAASPGVVAVLTAADIPGRNRFGVIPATADQPVFAEPDEEVRFRGEAVAMIVGEPEPMAALDTATFPVVWSELPPVMSIDDAQASGAPRLHPTREGNVLIRGNVRRGELDQAFAAAEIEVEGVSRPASSSTRTSSRRPGTRSASATGSRCR